MLGNGASFWADITLLTYILLILPLMLLGYYFARRKLFDPQHKIVMTLVLMLNYLLIASVMLRSFANGVAPGIPDNLSDLRVLLPTLHMIIGSVAQLSATYLVLLMWTENTRFENIVIYRVKRFKNLMRFTLVLWITTIVMGFGIYAIWYDAGSIVGASDAPDAVSTEEVMPEVAITEEVSPNIEVIEEITPEVETTEAVGANAVETPAGAVIEEAIAVTPAVATTEEPDLVTTEEALPCFATTEEAIIAVTEEVDVEDEACEDFLDELEDQLEDAEKAREEAEEERRDND